MSQDGFAQLAQQGFIFGKENGCGDALAGSGHRQIEDNSIDEGAAPA
jgi:hypothetical protein